MTVVCVCMVSVCVYVVYVGADVCCVYIGCACTLSYIKLCMLCMCRMYVTHVVYVWNVCYVEMLNVYVCMYVMYVCL